MGNTDGLRGRRAVNVEERLFRGKKCSIIALAIYVHNVLSIYSQA